MSQIPYFEDAINNFLKEKEDEMIHFLQKLISIPSESETIQERELARFIKNFFADANITTSLCDHTPECTSVFASFGSKEQSILLSCPLDTAPAGDIKKWSYHPYLGVVDKGRMYGRGTADCKGGMVAMLYAILALKAAQLPTDKLRVDLILDGGEHNGSFSGMRHALAHHQLPISGGIIGYASSEGFNEIAIGARGYHRYSFITHGKTEHSGSRFKKGVNAISAMARFIEELESTEFPQPKNSLFDFGSRLTFSLIEGGRAINMVPDECITKLDIRTTPEQSKKDADVLIQRAIENTCKTYPDFDIDFEYINGSEGYVLHGDESIIKALKKSLGDFTQKPPAVIVSGPAHVGNLLYQHHIPVVVRGPLGGNVHTYDEWVDVASIRSCAELYARTTLHYFGLAKPPEKEDHY